MKKPEEIYKPLFAAQAPMVVCPRQGRITYQDADKLEKLVGRAVVVKWKDRDSDWHHFRLEGFRGGTLSFTGMTDQDGSPHGGDFFNASLWDVVKIEERTS